MIGTIDVEINAAHPEMPLAEFAAFVNSPSHVRVRNVPRGVGNWQITAVYLSVNYPDNSLPSVSLTHVGALWTGTIGGSAVAGRSVNGYQITADGVDEDGNPIIGYVLGVGNVYILNRDGSITVGETTYYLHLLDDVPTKPKKSDVCKIDGTLKWYDGTAWQQFGAAVVPPSTDPADEGKAADAKATGDALATKRSMTDMRVPGAPYIDGGGNAVGKMYLDGQEMTFDNYYDPFWHALDGSFQVFISALGSYSVEYWEGSSPDPLEGTFTLSAANGYTATVLGHVVTGYAGTLLTRNDFSSLPSADLDPEETGITELCAAMNTIKNLLRPAAICAALLSVTAFAASVDSNKLVNLKGASNVVTRVDFSGLANAADIASATNALSQQMAPAIAAKASAAQVTNIVHDLSLGGIWDSSLQVWWTPRMVNGSLTYHATTNVNLNAED